MNGFSGISPAFSDAGSLKKLLEGGLPPEANSPANGPVLEILVDALSDMPVDFSWIETPEESSEEETSFPEGSAARAPGSRDSFMFAIEDTADTGHRPWAESEHSHETDYSSDMPSAVSGQFEMVYQKPSWAGGGGGDDTENDGSTDNTNTLFATYTSGMTDEYDTEGNLVFDFFNVEIQFYGTWDTAFMDAFATAADFISSIMSEGLWNDPESFNTFDPFGSNMFEVDDVLIEARMSDIDGTDGILGGANVYSVRSSSSPDPYTAVVSYMEFDNADAQVLLQNATWDDVVLHEMIHALGFGSLWDNYYPDLITETRVQISGQDTKRPNDDVYESTAVYNGALGNAEYQLETGGTQIEVETDGGSGTALAHWDEDAYGEEAMTGYIDTVNGAYMADWSLAALADIGYYVDIASFEGADQSNALSDGIDLETYDQVASYFDTNGDALMI